VPGGLFREFLPTFPTLGIAETIFGFPALLFSGKGKSSIIKQRYKDNLREQISIP